jgi:GH24 family phage-related lysozyme (muramidase)
MARWNKAGGKVLEGLIRRREAEGLLFENKKWT